MGACRSRTNADDRLPLAPLGPVEGGDGVVEGMRGSGGPTKGSRGASEYSPGDRMKDTAVLAAGERTPRVGYYG
jgi:hypothetical protein